MRFRSWKEMKASKLLIGFFLVGTLIGCQKYLNDRQNQQKPFELDLQGVQCLNQVPEVFSQYFQQKLDSTRLHDTTVCVDRAIVEFLRSTRGAEQAGYQTAEVQNFFQKYIFKREISPELSKEIMKLKAAMVGGTEEYISRAEFEKLRMLLKVFERELLRLYPHLNIFLMNETMNVTVLSEKNKLNRAVTDLKTSVQNLLGELHLADSEYSLPEVDLLMAEIEKFAGINNPDHPFSKWRRNLPTLEKLKTLLVGEVVEVRGQKEINEIWDLLIDVYRMGLQYYGGIRQLDWMTPQEFPEFDAWVEDLFSVLHRGFALRNRGQIPFERPDEIIPEFHARNVWLKPLDPLTAKQSYRMFIRRFLDKSEMDLTAVDVRHLIQLHREYRAFKIIQNALSTIFAQKDHRLVSEVVSMLEQYPIKNHIKEMSPLSSRDQDYFLNAWEEFLVLIKNPGVRRWDERGRVSVRYQRGQVWSYRELTRMNVLRIPTSMFMRAYATDKTIAPKDNVVGIEQIRLVFNEFEGFGDEMGLFDLRNTDSAGRSTREADMFTPSANGDGKVQFIEMFDLFSVMWSGGLVGVADFKTWATADGCVLPTIDYFRHPYMKMDCASASFHKHFAEIFPQLPQFTKYVKGLSNEQWDSFYRDLLVVGRICPEDPIGLETADQRTMIVVLHYIENLFAVYDRNRDGRFSEQEMEMAFPRFRDFMVNVTKQKVEIAMASIPLLRDFVTSVEIIWPPIALNVFKYILFKGRIPGGWDLAYFVMGSVFNDSDKTGVADRQSIVRVFAALKSEMSKSPANCSARR